MSKIVLNKFPKLLHGGDYNPDQWLDRPDILAKDIELMKEANVNCVSLGIFAWSALEPEEGVYRLDWLEEIINNLYANGIYTILATPTAAMPHWLTNKYQEVMQVDHRLVRDLPGKRHNYCYSSPVMRERTRAIDTVLAQRFGKHKAVILWHISNELGGNGRDGSCHCPYCQDAFRGWLKDKYQTLDNLNKAWWTSFWSHTYTDWNQIHSPVDQGEFLVHGLVIDWKRFVTHQTLDFFQEEAKIVKAYSHNLPVTANLMTFFKPLDYFKFKEAVDIVSWDSYPAWHSGSDEVDQAVFTAANHNVMRSIKKTNFLLMESTPSITNWASRCTQKRPGLHELASMQALALGSNSVQYFQWRKSRGSSEKFHGAVVSHDGSNQTRVFREVAQVGQRLKDISDDIYESCNQAKVAMIFDWENWWAIDEAKAAKAEMNYVDTVLSHYKPFWENGVDVDFIDMDQDLSQYDIVIAPMVYMLKEGYQKNVKEFVSQGGTYITTYWSNLVDETDLCFLEHHPLEEVLGLWVEELDATHDNRVNSFIYEGKEYQINDVREVSHPTTCEVLATYKEDYYKGLPTLTVNQYGEGKCYYIASRNEGSFHSDFYRKMIEEHGLTCDVLEEIPYGVTVSKRVGYHEFYFIQNFNEANVMIDIQKEGIVVGLGEKLAGTYEMGPFECLILECY